MNEYTDVAQSCRVDTYHAAYAAAELTAMEALEVERDPESTTQQCNAATRRAREMWAATVKIGGVDSLTILPPKSIVELLGQSVFEVMA